MGRKTPPAVGGSERRSANDVSGVRVEVEDSAFGQTEGRKMTWRIGFLVVVLLAQETRGRDEIKTLPVRNNVYMLVSAAGNTYHYERSKCHHGGGR